MSVVHVVSPSIERPSTANATTRRGIGETIGENSGETSIAPEMSGDSSHALGENPPAAAHQGETYSAPPDGYPALPVSAPEVSRRRHYAPPPGVTPHGTQAASQHSPPFLGGAAAPDPLARPGASNAGSRLSSVCASNAYAFDPTAPSLDAVWAETRRFLGEVRLPPACDPFSWPGQEGGDDHEQLRAAHGFGTFILRALYAYSHGLITWADAADDVRVAALMLLRDCNARLKQHWIEDTFSPDIARLSSDLASFHGPSFDMGALQAAVQLAGAMQQKPRRRD